MVVVGGGPAGASAAIVLARAGRDVVLVDRARFPRDKCCGDGLTTGALRLLDELGLSPAAVPSWQPVNEVWTRSPSGRTVSFPLPRRGAYAAVARREELDAALVDLARASGVDVHDGSALVDAHQADGQVVCDVEGLGEVSAPYVIGADGMWSPLRRALAAGAPGPTSAARTSAAQEAGEGVQAARTYLGEWHAFRQYFRNVGPQTRSAGSAGSSNGQLWVWFEPDLLPGYAWSFPLPGGRANVGFGIERRPGVTTRAMAAQWRELLTRPHLRAVLGPDAEPEGLHKAWPIPARLGADDTDGLAAAAGGRVLFAGDAARACDPMTGEGIGQALETGMGAAAAVLAAGPDRPGAAASAHVGALRRGMAVDHRLARFLQRPLRHGWGVRGAVRVAGATPWTRAQFGRWLFEDYPRALLLTPGRWHRGAFSTPGAWP